MNVRPYKPGPYGDCPNCCLCSPPGTIRERRPNGNTTCGECGAATPSVYWKKCEGCAEPAVQGYLLALEKVYRAAENWLRILEQSGSHYLDGVPGELMDAVDSVDELMRGKNE